jgi:polar amino acid transport system substrate-binding protein
VLRLPPHPLRPSRLIRALAAWLGLVLLAAGAARADDAIGEPVRVGCVDFPPFTYSDGNGKPAGMVLDLTTRLLDRLGLKWRAECFPGARLMSTLRDGTSDVAMIIRHPDVVGAAHYGHLPLMYLNLSAYRLPGKPPLGSFEASRHKSLILLRGYGYGGWSDFFQEPGNGIVVQYADSHPAALRMLASGHGDYLIDYREPAAAALQQTALAGIRGEILARLPVYFVVSHKTAGGETLLRRLEDAFRAEGGQPLE